MRVYTFLCQCFTLVMAVQIGNTSEAFHPQDTFALFNTTHHNYPFTTFLISDMFSDPISSKCSFVDDIVYNRPLNLTKENSLAINRYYRDQGVVSNEELISNSKTLGLFNAHRQAWLKIPEKGAALIVSGGVCQSLLFENVTKLDWSGVSILFLSNEDATGYAGSGRNTPMKCVSDNCWSYEIEAYILSFEGARMLLRHSQPASMSLSFFLNTFHNYQDSNFITGVTNTKYYSSTSSVFEMRLVRMAPRTLSGMLLTSLAFTVIGFTIGFVSQNAFVYQRLKEESTDDLSDLDSIDPKSTSRV